MPPLMRRIFWYFNKYFMVPLFRLGLGPVFCNPFSGYMMVLKTIGRKSGKTYYTPVNYTIHKGNVYCISGGRLTSDWYKNLLATPEIEIIMPGGAIFAQAEEINSEGEKRLVARQVLKNAGFAGFFEGYNPHRISDAELGDRIHDLPVLKFQPKGLGSGAADPSGWAWVWLILFTFLALWGLAVVL